MWPSLDLLLPAVGFCLVCVGESGCPVGPAGGYLTTLILNNVSFDFDKFRIDTHFCMLRDMPAPLFFTDVLCFEYIYISIYLYM